MQNYWWILAIALSLLTSAYVYVNQFVKIKGSLLMVYRGLGTAAVLLGLLLAGHVGAMWCVVAVFCGHVWPVFYKFKGGKGVATAFGALLGLNPLMALLTLLIVVIAVLISKRMSVGSITGAVVFPFISLFMERDFLYIGIVLAIIILVKHRANIMRLLQGKEPVMSIFEKKKTSDGQED